MREFIFSTYDKRFNLDKAGKAYSIANRLRHIRYQMLSSCNTGDSRLYFGYGDSRSYFLVLPLKSWVPVYFKLRSAPMENSGIPLQFQLWSGAVSLFLLLFMYACLCFACLLCMHAYLFHSKRLSVSLCYACHQYFIFLWSCPWIGYWCDLMNLEQKIK